LVADDDASWSRRRATYLAWLTADDEAFLAVATLAGQPVGYAMTRIDKGLDDTWDVGGNYAEVYTLSVAPHVRGQGVGSRLLDFVDSELVRRGIRGLAVAVMVGNADAQRFYERRGLRPGEVLFYRLGPAPDL
jgi:ribosomal protein S18 acetylase RimI-like enzyme